MGLCAGNKYWLEFLTGQGGAGVHSPGPTLATSQGSHFGGDPRAAPIPGASPVIPCKEPHFSSPVLIGTCLGNGGGQGQGQEILEKLTPCWAVEQGGAGNLPGGLQFSGP